MPTEMRFFANFFYRNYPSPFARHWQPTKMPLIQLAEMADDMAEVQGSQPPVYQVQKENCPEITAIQSELLKIGKMLQSQSRSTNEQRPSPGPSQSGICWYHERFSSNAKKCREPCEFRTQPGNSTAIGERSPHDWQLSTSPRF